MTSETVRSVPARASRSLVAVVAELVVPLGMGAIILALALGLAEGASRLIHRGSSPLLPIRYDAGVFPQTHRGVTIRMDVPDAPAVEYVMNEIPARVATPEVGAAAPDVLVIGDSQALGWALPFEQTVGARIATQRFGSTAHAMLLATPATDPELSLHNLRDARQRWSGQDPKVAVFYINFGNDLDEVFVGRQRHHFSGLARLQDWLSTHSSFALDLNKIALAGTLRNRLGINEVLFASTADERRELARALADAADAGLAMFGADTRRVVVLIPNDYQVNPAEFRKYEPTYTDKSLYAKYEGAVARMKQDMDDAYSACRSRLRELGLDVVDVSELAAAGAATFYDRYSHHLNAAANAAVADAIVRRIVTPAEAPVGQRDRKATLAGVNP